MSTATVALADVSKSYGSQLAVAGVSLAFCAAECIALVGHNGAGKSTLIKLMLGLIRPNEGSVRVLGEDPGTHAGAGIRCEIGYLPENVALPPTMTGEELLAFYARLKRQPVARNRRILERVGIAHAARRRIGTCSKGMRQRLALAQAIIGRPRVLFLDEPTSGLDPDLRQTFYEIIRDLRADGATILVSTHALAEIEGQADRIVVMNQGRKIADGSILELRRQAQRPVRIRVTVQDEHIALLPAVAGPGIQCRRVGERMLEIECTEHEKIDVMRRLTAGTVSLIDVEMVAPTLDDLYAHFRFREAAE